MGISSYSPSASLNTSLAGITIAPGMARADVDNALRQILADVANDLGGSVTVNPKAFGALLGGTDDTAAVQAAINAASALNLPCVLPAAIRFGSVSVPGNTHIRGPGAKSAVTAIAGSYNTFRITGSDVTIENVRIDCAAKTGGYEFEIACGINVIERTRILNVNTFNARGGIIDSGTTGYHVTTILDHVQFRGHNGPGVVWTRGFAFLQLVWTTVDFVGVSTSNYTGFDINFAGLSSGAGGLEFRQCDVLGTAGTYNLSAQIGFNVRNGGAIWFNKTRADTVGGVGYTLSNCFAVTFDAQSSAVAGTGVEMTSVVNSYGTITVIGRSGMAYAPASTDGIKFISGCYNVNLHGGIVRDCTGNGINKIAAQSGIITLVGYQSTNNIGRGLKTTGNSTFQYSGALIGNTAGNYDLGGTLDYVTGTMINAGTVTSVGPGPLAG